MSDAKEDGPVSGDELGALAGRAKAAGQRHLAGVLYCLAGAVTEGSEREVFGALVPFSERSVRRLSGGSAGRN